MFLAAGSGITPILSMLRYIEETSPECNGILLYASRNERQIIFKAELERFAARLSNFRFVPIVTRPSVEWSGERGQLTKEMVLKALPVFENKTFFLCGPAGFMSAIEVVLTFWTQKRAFLRWWAALKMEESQCPEPVRVTHPA